MIGVQDTVRETLEMTGFQHSVIMLDTYDAAEIESDLMQSRVGARFS